MKKINFNKQNITKTPSNNLKYNYNIFNSLKEQILSPGDEDISYKEKPNFNYNYKQEYNISSSIINESDINFNSINNNNTQKKTLILDLDETLVHSSFKPIIYNNIFYPPDIFLTINFNGNTHRVYVLKRPFLQEFLKEMNKSYNIIIFTASVKEYANPLLDIIDKEKIIKKRFFREHCTFTGGKYIKKLENIGQDLKNTILVDNNPISYCLNKNNGMPIKSWHFDKTDKELLNIMNALNFLANVSDVRDYIPNIINNHSGPKTKSQNNLLFLVNNEEINKYSRNKLKKNEESKLSVQFNNYDNKNNNDIEIKKMKATLKNKITNSITQFKSQIKIYHNKYNNSYMHSYKNNNNDYMIKAKISKEKINNNNNDIFYGFKFAKEKNYKNIKNEELNFDYSTPRINNKYINKFPKNSKSMKNINIKLYNNYTQNCEHNNYNKKNIYNKNRNQTYMNDNENENEKNMNLLYNNNNLNRYYSSYKISKGTNTYIKKRMKLNEEKIY